MKKSLIALTVAAATAATAAPLTANAAVGKFFGYSQITAAVGKGNAGKPDGLRFGADRIRLGYKIKQGHAWGKLQVDFNKTGTKAGFAVPEIVKDAVVGYKFNNVANLSAGIFKTPIGMDFNTSGKKLDITKRGMEKKLVLERAAGFMLSGRKMSGFGYDIGVFNPALRSSAVKGGKSGSDHAFAGRVMYNMGKTLHVEASYGSSGNAGTGTNTRTYSVYDVAGRAKFNAITVKAEYIRGRHVQGTSRNESVWYVGGGYALNHMLQGVVRYYSANSNDQTLGNTYIGANIFLAGYNARVQLNYVVASGDTDTFSGVAIKGYTRNVFLAQFQVGF